MNRFRTRLTRRNTDFVSTVIEPYAKSGLSRYEPSGESKLNECSQKKKNLITNSVEYTGPKIQRRNRKESL